MESNSKTFNLTFVVIPLHQLKIFSSKRKSVQPDIKIIEYVFLICNSRFSFRDSNNFKCFITEIIPG